MAITSAILPTPVAAAAPVARPAAAGGFEAVLAPLTSGSADGQARPPEAKPASVPAGTPRQSGQPPSASGPHSRPLKPEAGHAPEPAGKSLADPAPATVLSVPLPAPMGSVTVTAKAAEPESGVASGRASKAPQAASGRSNDRFADADELPANPGSAQAGQVPPGSFPAGLSPESDEASPDDAATPKAAAPKGVRAHKTAAQDAVASGPAGRDAVASGPAGAPPGPAAAPTADAGGRGPQLPLPAADPGAAVSPAGSSPTVEAPRDALASAASDAAPPAQIGHALAAVHTAPDGSSQVRILLNPAELGSVQVRITRRHDGVSSVTVAVERPETLRSLQGDLGHLHQALDRAGLPEQRSVVFHLAASDAPPAAGGGGSGAGGQGTAQGGSHQDSRRDPQPARFPPDMHGRGEAGIRAEAGWTAPVWHRAGVNITA